MSGYWNHIRAFIRYIYKINDETVSMKLLITHIFLWTRFETYLRLFSRLFLHECRYEKLKNYVERQTFIATWTVYRIYI